MCRWPAALVTISSLLVTQASSAHAQAEDSGQAATTTLPPLPPVAAVAQTPSTMVTVTAPGATVDCGSVRVELQCPRMELPAPTVGRKPRRRWYGWQTLITDSAGLAMLFAATTTSNNTGSWLAASGLTYSLGGPIVHWAHGNGGKGAASLGLRLGLPVGLGLLGFAAGSAMSGGKGYGGAVLGVFGFVAGFPAAIAIDSAALAREDVEEEEEPIAGQASQAKLQTQRPWLQVHPDVQTSHTGAQVGVRGTF
jgi:hypothetical protein